MNILRRLPLSRLLLLCGLAIAIGVSATALAFAVGSGPTPPAKPLAQAIHDALASGSERPVEGLSASITWTDHLLEGANLASGNGGSGGLTSSPLVSGASGRLWIAKDGHLRIELQSQQGDTQIVYDGHTLSLYDAATNTLYRYAPPAEEGTQGHEGSSATGGQASGHEGSGATGGQASGHGHEVPSVAKVEEAIARLSKHADVSGATPTDVAGQPAYTVRLSPKEGGSLFGGVELSFDANHGLPLRAAVYSSTSTAPVLELAASEVSYGPVESSVFELNPPADVKVQEIKTLHGAAGPQEHEADHGEKPHVTTSGRGPATIVAVEAKDKDGKGAGETLEGLPKVNIDGTSASELRTELGTILSFTRAGVRYLVAGFVSPAAVEAVARGL